MIIPINSGRTITPIYIPQPVTSIHNNVLEQNSTNTQGSEPTVTTWIALVVVVVFLIATAICSIKCLIKLLEEISGGKSDG